LACCWMTLLGPATESCTYVLLAPGLAWWLLEARRERRARAAQGLLWASYGLLLAAQCTAWLPWGRELHNLGIHPAAALLFLATLAGMAGRARGGRAGGADL